MCSRMMRGLDAYSFRNTPRDLGQRIHMRGAVADFGDRRSPAIRSLNPPPQTFKGLTSNLHVQQCMVCMRGSRFM